MYIITTYSYKAVFCMFVYILNRVSTRCYSYDFISRFGPLSIMTDAFSVRPEVSIFALPRSFFPAFGCFDSLIMHSGLLSSTPSLSGLKYMCMCMCVYMCLGSILRCAILALYTPQCNTKKREILFICMWKSFRLSEVRCTGAADLGFA